MSGAAGWEQGDHSPFCGEPAGLPRLELPVWALCGCAGICVVHSVAGRQSGLCPVIGKVKADPFLGCEKLFLIFFFLNRVKSGLFF